MQFYRIIVTHSDNWTTIYFSWRIGIYAVCYIWCILIKKKKTQLHVCYTDLNLDHELFFLYN